MAKVRNEQLLRRVAARLKQLRMQKGLTLEEVYNDTEIHIARIEAEQKNITLSTLDTLCNYYGVTLTQFFMTIESAQHLK